MDASYARSHASPDQEILIAFRPGAGDVVRRRPARRGEPARGSPRGCESRPRSWRAPTRCGAPQPRATGGAATPRSSTPSSRRRWPLAVSSTAHPRSTTRTRVPDAPSTHSEIVSTAMVMSRLERRASGDGDAAARREHLHRSRMRRAHPKWHEAKWRTPAELRPVGVNPRRRVNSCHARQVAP